MDAAPLLEKEGDAGVAAQPQYSLNPCWLQRSGTPTAFAADDGPIDSRNVEIAQILQQWLDRKKLYRSGCGTKLLDAGQTIAPVLDANAPPDMPVPCREAQFRRQKFEQPFRALR